MKMIPNLICCDKQTVVEEDLDQGIERQEKLVFNPGRFVASLVLAGAGVLVGFLPTAKKKSADSSVASAEMALESATGSIKDLVSGVVQ